MNISPDQGAITLTFKNLEDAKKLGFNYVTYDDYSAKITSQNAPAERADKIKIKVDHKFIDYKVFRFKDNFQVENLEELKKYILKLCPNIFKTCEFSEDIFKFSLVDGSRDIIFDKYLVKCLGLEKSRYNHKKDQVFTSVRKSKLTETYQNMLIYSNVVDPIIVGDVHVPLFKSIWFEKYKVGEVANISIENPMYLPISSSCINNIEINIRDDAGRLINFADDTKTTLTLHFKKVDE